jgi:hypothetical protein
MLADPPRDIGLRVHDALIERHVSGELKVLLLAPIGQRQCAHREDYLDETHCHSPMVIQSH